MEIEQITSTIISSAWTVWKTHGSGFLEQVYKLSLAIELRLRGLNVLVEKPIAVWYKNQKAGQYYADLLVEDKVIVETKTARKIVLPHILQAKHYLKSTQKETALIISFSDLKVETKRIYADCFLSRNLSDNLS